MIETPPATASERRPQRNPAARALALAFPLTLGILMASRGTRLAHRSRPVAAPAAPRRSARVIVLVPAYREVDSLPHVLEALHRQTRPADRVIVTLDPHEESRRTAELEQMAQAAGAEVWHSVGNRHKKAGNLNGALGRLLPEVSDQDAILVQDADTYLDPQFIEVTRRKMEQGFGAVGGNFRGRPGGRLCGAFQRNEFARYARDTARKKGKVLCLTGTACLFKAGALKDVLAARTSGRLPPAEGVYDTKALTEDNELTLALKHLHHRVVAPSRATMTTEVMETWKALAKQRLRWKRGALENLIDYGVTRYTTEGWARQVVAFLGASVSTAYVGSVIWFLTVGSGLTIAPFWIVFTGFYAIERAVTVKSRGWRVSIASMLVLPEWFFDLFLQGVHIRALADTALRRDRRW
ncbi:glycosyltransferase family 2 protein [Streptomyces afghaniensis]|uniref:glycosyltransferase family 2 protein n=1 Tax=Streptomyces afghaniensis TaxID=66865 RepID=UPI002780F437|nr:glycosyltransferase family 2 protein [Streptomyces afghaniensis]MDQ1021913.1 biofilm PGA synthesis N-glycosyltransferase PgaC [Streptomyces afghaniensis]